MEEDIKAAEERLERAKESLAKAMLEYQEAMAQCGVKSAAAVQKRINLFHAVVEAVAS